MERTLSRLLVWVDNPKNSNELSVDSEIDGLRTLWGQHKKQIEVCHNLPDGLLALKIREYRPTLFHYIGHGMNRDICHDVERSGAEDEGYLGLHDSVGRLRKFGWKEFKELLDGSPEGGPEAIFLNSCYSGRWTPDLAPRSGWMIALNHEVHDDEATTYALSFYGFMFSGLTPWMAHLKTRARMVSDLYMEEDLPQRLWPGRDVGPLVYGAEAEDKPEPIAIALAQVRQVFERPVFLVSAKSEGQLLLASEAMAAISKALVTGESRTRRPNNEAPFFTISIEYLNLPIVRDLIDALGPAITVASNTLSNIFRCFPLTETVRAIDVYFELDQPHQDLLLSLLQNFDLARNRILEMLNHALSPFGLEEFRLIDLS